MFAQWLAQILLNTAEAAAPCPDAITGVATESLESPFFDHFHQLTIPVEALIKLPAQGVQLKTSPIDLESYDSVQLEKFVKDSKLDQSKLLTHTHDVFVDQKTLSRIAAGEENVEIKVISARGNFVHNFKFTASPAIKTKLKRQSQS
jgi:hypothetical protein